MNSYPDPTPETSEPLLNGEPEYREYPSASPQPRIPAYPTAPSSLPEYTPVANVPALPMQAPPYPYSPVGQASQPLTLQSTPASPTAKASSRGWIFLLSSIGLLILALGGVLIYAFSQNLSSNPITTNATATPGSINTSQPGVVKLGQSLTVNGLTATLLSVEPLAGDGTINPDAGNKFMVVHIQLHNNQNTAQVYSSFDFHVLNGSNQERNVEFIAPNTYTAGQQLSEDDLAPNDTVTGDLIIQVPVNDHNTKLGWNPGNNATSDSAYAWNLGL